MWVSPLRGFVRIGSPVPQRLRDCCPTPRRLISHSYGSTGAGSTNTCRSEFAIEARFDTPCSSVFEEGELGNNPVSAGDTETRDRRSRGAAASHIRTLASIRSFFEPANPSVAAPRLTHEGLVFPSA